MKLSVIVPVYNESHTILNLVDRVLNSSANVHQIIIINDGSKDNTAEKLQTLKGNPKITVLTHDKNQGKGAGIRTAIPYVSGDIVVIQDADLEYDPAEYPKLLQPILDDQADVVFGSRFQSGLPHRVVFFWHMLGNRFLTFVSNAFTNLNLTDMETCYKMFRTDILKQLNLRENRFAFEPEVTAKISKLHCRIYEVGISYYGRTYSEGKKITWKDGFSAFYSIIRYNLFS